MKRRMKFLVILPCLAAAAGLGAYRPDPTAAVARLTGVSVQSNGAGQILVTLVTSRATAYHVYRMEKPARLVLDLDRAALDVPQRWFPGHDPVVKQVRVGQFRGADPAIVRVVADVVGQPAFEIQRNSQGLRLVIASGEATARASAPPAAAKTSPALAAAPPNPPVLPRVEANSSADGVPRLAEPAVTPNRSSRAPALAPVAMTAPPAPPEMAPAAAAARVVAQGQENHPSAPIVVSPATPAAKPQQLPPTPYTGERISLNLKDVDLKDFFRLIHEISGLNIIIDPNVSGTVTLVLDDVPWDQALDIVLKNNGLGKVLEGNVLRIAKIQTLTAEQEDAVRLKEAQIDSEPLVTVFRPLNYARVIGMAGGAMGGGASPAMGGAAAAGPMTDVLSIVKNFLSKRGTVVADPRNNALVITDVQSQIPIIDSVIQQLDRKTKQVSIEAKIVLATDDFTRQLQSALNGGTVSKNGINVTGGSTGSGASAQSNIPTSPPQPTRLTIGQTNASGFGAYALSSLGARYFIGVALAAAESRNQAKVISSPTIMTQNNVRGEVVQGTQIPVQTTINNTVTTIYINAALTLDVTPQVTDDGHIFLIIQVQNNSPGPVLPGTQNPEINTQSATTQVLVSDGGTVIFGGVKLTANTKSYTEVPGLGRIPLLGNLFKSTNREVQTNDLLFIITPKIITS